jgi:hypothetical protein
MLQCGESISILGLIVVGKRDKGEKFGMPWDCIDSEILEIRQIMVNFSRTTPWIIPRHGGALIGRRPSFGINPRRRVFLACLGARDPDKKILSSIRRLEERIQLSDSDER